MSSLLEQEIYSQPAVIAHLLERETAHIRQVVAQLPPFNYVLIAARGSSDHAATYAQYAWAALAGYPVALATPSLQTLYKTSPRMESALIVGISQSGQSPDIIAVLAEGKRQGRPTLAITNDGSSPLAAIADHVIKLHAGSERSIAATKTYTAQLVVMALFAAICSGHPKRLAEIQSLPAALTRKLRYSSAHRTLQVYGSLYRHWAWLQLRHLFRACAETERTHLCNGHLLLFSRFPPRSNRDRRARVARHPGHAHGRHI